MGMRVRRQLIHCSSPWRPLSWHQQRRALPSALRPWLMTRTSLTAHLCQAAGGTARVEVLRERWQHPTPAEALFLNCPRQSRLWCRDVLLMGHDQPWILARSVIPPALLHHNQSALARLGTEFLGRYLFQQPEFWRGTVEVRRCFTQSLPQFHGIRLSLDHPRWLWGRRSRFHLGRHRLMVMEYFLPGLPPFPGEA